MDIIKRLNLNKTPKDVINGGIVCAKNMMIDDTGSFLTNDIGFKEACSFDNEIIVGVIPCSNEIVILTVEDIQTSEGTHIYRKFDNGELARVRSSWSYSGGNITGSYTYNYKNELILTIAEKTPGVPLKSFIIKENTDSATSDYYKYVAQFNQTYNIEEDIPKYDTSYTIQTKGELVCGVYTFFMRFKIDTDNYTKWFQISADIIITHDVTSKKYNHEYGYKANGEASGQTVQHLTEAETFLVNEDGISNKNILLNISLLNESRSNEIQIGYIIKRKGDIQGRILGDYVINLDEPLIVSVINNLYLEEVGVTELLENPHQFYNVGLTNVYNNRLYIADYEEYQNEDLRSQVEEDVEVSAANNTIIDITPAPAAFKKADITLRLSVRGNGGTYDDTITLRGITMANNGDLTPEDSIALIAKLANKIPVKVGYITGSGIETTPMLWMDDNLGEYNLSVFWMLQRNTQDICIYKNVQGGYNAPPAWASSYDFKDPQYYIDHPEEDEEYIVNIDLDNGKVIVKTRNKGNFVLLGDSASSTILGVSFWDNPNDPNETILTYYWGLHNPIENSLADDADYTKSIDSNRYPTFPGGLTLQWVYYNITEYVDTEEGDTPIEEDTIVDIPGVGLYKGVNTRTLIPYQVYNFFIHYIRKDGSVTPGYHIGKRAYKTEYGKLIVPSFKVKAPAQDYYVGYFISYEDVERHVECVYIINKNGTKITVTNAQLLYDLDTVRGTILYTGGNTFIIDNNTLEYISNRLIENHLRFDVNEAGSILEQNLAILNRIIENKYSSKTKTLYRLTKNIYRFDETIADQDYLPDFYNRQTIIYYVGSRPYLIINPSIEFVTGITEDVRDTNQTFGTYKVYIPQNVKMYSKYPTEAMNVKQDFEQAAYVPTDNDSNPRVIFNVLVSPDKLHDYLELQSCYRAKPSKVYINYREDNISTFNKTVYRSDVVSDESLVNGFRHFATDNYKNILENKGKITNIVGIGLYLLVHTEYSLFVFDRSPKLTAKYQMNVPDTFDVDYQEVMPSNEGFGGLLDKEQSIISKHGYIWFDKANKTIFCYENGSASIISGDIHNFLQYIDIDDVRFAEDIIHNRLIVCIKTNNDYITLSYNFNSKTYISMHDYKFTNNYRTYNKSYVFDKDKPSLLYEFDDDSIADYGELKYENGRYFPAISEKSYVDVIYNLQYETSKVLESISYVLNQIEDKIYNIIVSEEDLNRRFSGNILKIYSDENNTGDLDINTDNNINEHNNYKYPYWDKGRWNLNYFRNKIADRNIDDTNKNDAHKTRPDNLNVVYGKYFVVRFIFDNDRKVKLETIHFNVNPY